MTQTSQSERRGRGRPRKFLRQAEAAKMRAEGMTWIAIAKALDVPDQTLWHSMREIRPMIDELLKKAGEEVVA